MDTWVKRTGLVVGIAIAIALIGCAPMKRARDEKPPAMPTDAERIEGDWTATRYEITVGGDTRNVLARDMVARVIGARFADGAFGFSCTPRCIDLYDTVSGTYTVDEERNILRYEITDATGSPAAADGVGLVGYWHYRLPSNDALHFNQVVEMPPDDQTDTAIHMVELKRVAASAPSP